MIMKMTTLSGTLIFAGVIFTGLSTASAEEAAGNPINFAAKALPNAKPGECYAKVMIPAQYTKKTEEIVKRDAYEKIEIIPAKYETVEEKVLIKEASEKLVPVPPVYEKVEERIEIRPARTVWRMGTKANAPIADMSLIAGASALGLSKTATAGQCFREFHQAAQYKTETKQVLKKEASKRVEIIPARYETVEEKVLVREAAQRLVKIPPEYETVTEQILERPAYTTWKKGRGPVERLDNSTGEIMCLVEIPAKYQTIKKRVLKTPAATKKVEIPAEYTTQKVRKLISPPQEKTIEIPAEHETVSQRIKLTDAKTQWMAKGSAGEGERTGRILCRAEIPAKYKTVEKRVVKAPATIKKVQIPAAYQTQEVRKLVTPAQEKRIKIPAAKQAITKRVKVSDARLEWRPVLCETNMTRGLNTKIQRALKQAGLKPGPIDGVIGSQTLLAVDAFQRQKGLPTGGLTMRTLNELGVKLAP